MILQQFHLRKHLHPQLIYIIIYIYIYIYISITFISNSPAPLEPLHPPTPTHQVVIFRTTQTTTRRQYKVLYLLIEIHLISTHRIQAGWTYQGKLKMPGHFTNIILQLVIVNE